MFRQWEGDLLGQNLVPEIALAGELELCYAGVATVTDISADRSSSAPQGEMQVRLEVVIDALPRFVEMLAAPTTCACTERLSAPRKRGTLANDWWKREQP